MANLTPNEQRRFIDFSNLIVDYTDDDVQVYEHARNIASLFPLKNVTNLIAVCTAGTLRINDAQPITIRTNDVFFCSPNASFSDFQPSSDFDCMIICLSDHIVRGMLHDRIEVWRNAVYVNQVFQVTLSESCTQELSFYLSLIGMKIKNREQRKPYEILQALVRSLLLELCFMLENTKDKLHENVKLSQGKVFFNRFLGMLSSNDVKRRPINYYAEKLAITPKYLTMLCLKYSDKTASEWIIQYTTEDIRFYLKNSNLSIKEISAKLGFANMSHFGSYVRKHLGASPSDFRHDRM
jgi:AraC-like DNA-binding protein